MMRATPFAVAATALVLSGCMAGPGPGAGRVELSLSPPVAPETIAPVAGVAQRVDPAASVRPDWWAGFASAKLSALVERALAHNQDIATAEAALRQAREQAGAMRGAGLPQVDIGYQAERARVSQVLSSPLADVNDTLYSLHTAQVSVVYPLDLFGAQRGRVRSARAARDVAAARLTAARLTIAGNVALATIGQAALAAQVVAAEDAVRSNAGILDLLRKRQALGDIGAADVTTQSAALANAEAALPPLRRQLAHQRAVIAALVGVAPGAEALDLPRLDELALPQDLPLVLPADIVARRPDLRAAEAQVRGAAADLGSAVAARLPQLQLSGNAGGSAERLGSLFSPANLFFALVGGLTQPVFHGGTLRHQQRAAQAALDGAQSQYRGAAIQAFVEVDDALAGLRTDSQTLDAAARAHDAAGRALDFTRRQVELGGVGTLALLNAGIISSQAAQALIQARAARLVDTVALFQAVGGGIDGSGQGRENLK